MIWTTVFVVVCLWMIFVYVPWEQRVQGRKPPSVEESGDPFEIPDHQPSEVRYPVYSLSDYEPCGEHIPTGREQAFNEAFSNVQEGLRDSSRHESPSRCYDRSPEK